MIFGVTRFSVYVPKYKAWRLNRASSEDEYLRILFADERLQPRFDIFLNKALPIYQEASKQYNYRHILHYSDLLPEKWKKLLFEAAEKNSVLYLNKVETSINTNEVILKILQEQKAESSSVAWFRVDDDDILGLGYFEKLATYVRPEMNGLALSFPSGIATTYSDGAFDGFSKMKDRFIAIGIAYIGHYDSNKKTVSFPKDGNHTLQDIYSPTILDDTSGNIYIYTLHKGQDTASDLKNKISMFMGNTINRTDISDITMLFPTIKEDINRSLNNKTLIPLDIACVSLGENGLADDILKRHLLKSFTTPYSNGSGNIDYAIFLESINYKGLIDKENLKYDYDGDTKVLRSTIANKSDGIYADLCMNGFEFAKNDDVLGSDRARDGFNAKIQGLLDLRNKNKVVFFYHHRVNKNSNLESIFEKARKFLGFYSQKEQALMVIFTQKIIKNKSERKLVYKKISNTIHFFEFCTERAWAGSNPDIFWARVDDDLVKEMIQSSVGIVNGKNGHITPSLPKKVVKNINTDYTISLGTACEHACRPAHHLSKNNLRVASNPLDWVSRYSLDTVIHLFKTGFSDFFYNIEEDVSKASHHRCVKDISNNIFSVHFFSTNVPLEEAAQLHHGIMKTRYERMHNNILQSDHILFVSNRNEPLDNFKKFLFSMYDIYHKKFTCLNIRNSEKESEVSIDFTEELKFIEYSFVDAHKGGADPAKNDFYWMGNVQKWTEIMQTITLSGKIPAAKALKDFH